MLKIGYQIVYVLTNPAMPGLVKIGKTSQLETEARMRQLYGTGVPVPFDCAFACQVKDAHEVEKALHFAFGNTRVNPNREFFKIEAERVISVLRLLKVDEVTEEFENKIEADTEEIDKQSAEIYKEAIRPKMNFHELDTPTGSVLISKNGKLQVRVVEAKKVELNGEVMSLTMATRRLLGLPNNQPIQPSPYWTFNARTVKEIYENYHSENED